MTKTEFTFDEKKHEYRLNGYPVPSVTQVLSDLLPQWRAGEWHLQRGRAIHAACAMLLRGQNFDYDKRIEGPIQACRNFLNTAKPVILEIEKPAFSRSYQFAGTIDALVRGIGLSSDVIKQITIIDWKSSLNRTVVLQLAAYGLLHDADYGVAVQLNDDGTYKCSEMYNLKPFKREFLALLTAYNVRKRLSLTEKETYEKTGND